MKFVNLLIKPASSLCNLRCRYCFYEDVAENRAEKSMGIMREATVQALLHAAFAAVEPNGSVSFAFQGGEPTLAGLCFFEDFAARAHGLCPSGVQLSFSIQTNGRVLNEDWAAFLRQNRFLVGLSVDGCKELHNLHRVDEAQNGTWNTVTKAFALLTKAGVEVNLLCVVTAQCARKPEKVYQTMKKLGARYLQFIPCLDPLEAPRGSMPFSLTPEAYGAFLCKLFDLWYDDWKNGTYISVRLFEDYVHVLRGDGAGACSTTGRCGGYFVVEADGGVYPCDFFVLDAWRMGSLATDTLEALAQSHAYKSFLAQSSQKPAACAACRWYPLCGGGCKRDWTRVGTDACVDAGAGDGGAPLGNYYCGALQTFFAYSAQRLAIIADAERRARGR